MGRFEQRDTVADVRAGRNAQAADQTGAEVGEDVAIEVFHDHHVVEFRLLDQLHAHIVHEHLLILDVRVLFRHFLSDLEKQAVGVLHDIGFGYRADLFAAVGARILEGSLNDAARAGDGDRLDGDRGVLPNLAARHVDDLLRFRGMNIIFDARVQVFGVLAHDDEIDILILGADTGIVFAGPDTGVEVEFFAERDVHRAEAGADGSGDRAFQRDFVLTDAVQNVLRQRRPGRLKNVHARFDDIPVEFNSGRVQYLFGGGDQFRSRPIAPNEGHIMCQGSLL